MALACLVDGVDGTLARVADVRRVVPGFDGALLDNLVDYLNYAVVPAWLIYRSEILPDGTGMVAAAGICVTAAFQFARTDAKTADHLFRGFPSYWNVAAFYGLILRPSPSIALAVVVVLSGLSFVPVYFVYPTRTARWRPLTMALTVLWAAAVVAMILSYPSPRSRLAILSLLYPAYYGVVSGVVHLERRRGSQDRGATLGVDGDSG